MWTLSADRRSVRINGLFDPITVKIDFGAGVIERLTMLRLQMLPKPPPARNWRRPAAKLVHVCATRCGYRSQRGEEALPDTTFSPPVEADEDAVPLAENFQQIAPRRAGAGDPQHRRHEHPVLPPVPRGLPACQRTVSRCASIAARSEQPYLLRQDCLLRIICSLESLVESGLNPLTVNST